MSNGYVKIRLVVVSQQKGKTKHTNPKTLNSNNNTKSLVWVGWWWYNCEFRVIPLPAQTPTRARLGSWSRQGQGRVRARALQGIDNYSNINTM